MESGLEDRNNWKRNTNRIARPGSLNGVRPRRPEQSVGCLANLWSCLCLNGVRPRRPEQYMTAILDEVKIIVSMESGLEDRNNYLVR